MEGTCAKGDLGGEREGDSGGMLSIHVVRMYEIVKEQIQHIFKGKS